MKRILFPIVSFGCSNRMKKILFFIIFMSIVPAGCTQEINLYSSETPLSPFKVATIEIQSSWYAPLKLEVDKQPVNWERRGIYPVYIRMLPGKHELKWSFEEVNFVPTNSGQSQRFETDYNGSGFLDAKEGKFYVFHFVKQTGRTLGSMGMQNTAHGFISYQTVELKDKATWVEDKFIIFGSKVVAGNKPSWTDSHTCEICGKEKAAPYQYGCFKCQNN